LLVSVRLLPGRDRPVCRSSGKGEWADRGELRSGRGKHERIHERPCSPSRIRRRCPARHRRTPRRRPSTRRTTPLDQIRQLGFETRPRRRAAERRRHRTAPAQTGAGHGQPSRGIQKTDAAAGCFPVVKDSDSWFRTSAGGQTWTDSPPDLRVEERLAAGDALAHGPRPERLPRRPATSSWRTNGVPKMEVIVPLALRDRAGDALTRADTMLRDDRRGRGLNRRPRPIPCGRIQAGLDRAPTRSPSSEQFMPRSLPEALTWALRRPVLGRIPGRVYRPGRRHRHRRVPPGDEGITPGVRRGRAGAGERRAEGRRERTPEPTLTFPAWRWRGQSGSGGIHPRTATSPAARTTFPSPARMRRHAATA